MFRSQVGIVDKWRDSLLFQKSERVIQYLANVKNPWSRNSPNLGFLPISETPEGLRFLSFPAQELSLCVVNLASLIAFGKVDLGL